MFQDRAYRVILDPTRPRPLYVVRNGKVIAETARARWKPWRLDIGDVDGDGQPELAIGIFKPTRFIREAHTSVFFYTFDGRKIRKKWLGSSLGRPVVDFCLTRPDASRRCLLMSLQRTGNGGEIALSRYQWSGFGFRKTSPEPVWQDARQLHRIGTKIGLIANGKRIVIDPFAHP